MSRAADSLSGLKCVITPNTRTIKPVTVRVRIPAGTPVIQSFSLDADGTRTVHQTLVPGFGILEGDLRKSKA